MYIYVYIWVYLAAGVKSSAVAADSASNDDYVVVKVVHRQLYVHVRVCASVCECVLYIHDKVVCVVSVCVCVSCIHDIVVG